MLKSFPIVKVIKKNWKVIALLLLLLVVALVILGLYPKIQEGIDDKQIGATSTSAVVSFTSDATSFTVGSNPPITGVTLGGSGDKSGYTITGLKPNTTYKGIKVTDSNKKVAYTGPITTLPDQNSIVAPTFTQKDLTNIHSQNDADGKLCAYIKFDADVDLKYTAQGASTAPTGFVITDFEIKDTVSNDVLNGQLDVNPETGTRGWCKVTGLTPGKKYNLQVNSVCDIPNLLKTVLPNFQGAPPTILKSTGGKNIELVTAPVAVSNIVVGTPVKSGNTYDVTVTFDTLNGEETSYKTSLNCDGGIIEIPAAVSNGKGSITIKNVKGGATYKDVTVSAVVKCDKPQKTDGSNDCSAKCNMSVPSNKSYKKMVSGKSVALPISAGSVFAITTP